MESEAIAVMETGLSLTPVMDLQLAKSRLKQFQEFVADYLVEGEDYGRIPGTPKPTLLKPGADKLCELYGLADTYEIIGKLTDWDKGLFEYEIKCRLISKRDGSVVAEGMGCCNSYEGKYRWRDSQRTCPECGQTTIVKGKEEYGGGWLCFKKKGGCGAKWPDGADEIESQTIGRVENDDIAAIKNTILKMAKKRSKIDASLSATRSSGIFTQDIEDMQQTNQVIRKETEAGVIHQKELHLRDLMTHACHSEPEVTAFYHWLETKRTEKELDAAIGKIERKIKAWEKQKVREAEAIDIQDDPDEMIRAGSGKREVEGFKSAGKILEESDPVPAADKVFGGSK